MWHINASLDKASDFVTMSHGAHTVSHLTNPTKKSFKLSHVRLLLTARRRCVRNDQEVIDFFFFFQKGLFSKKAKRQKGKNESTLMLKLEQLPHAKLAQTKLHRPSPVYSKIWANSHLFSQVGQKQLLWRATLLFLRETQWKSSETFSGHRECHSDRLRIMFPKVGQKELWIGINCSNSKDTSNYT